ncbi:MAG: error-prone DNA polymerase [Pseudomonadota bacterium]
MYAELHALSNFTFLRGASHPEELVQRAAALGYSAIAITDECSVAGVVRAHVTAREHGIRLVIGAEFVLTEGHRLVLLARNRRGYGELCTVITQARRAAPKGQYRLSRHDLRHPLTNVIGLWVPGADIGDTAYAEWLHKRFPSQAHIAVELAKDGFDARRLAALESLGQRTRLPLVATGGVLMHCRSRRRLQDVLTAIRLKQPLTELGFALLPSGERYLRPIDVLQRSFAPAMLARSVELAESIDFSLDELRYEYPHELVPDGETSASWLRKLTYRGLRRRWPDGAPESVVATVEHELALIAELAYEPYFLTVQDIVAWARSQRILCQGRGSAANSAVCYCLGVTEVDPARLPLLVERFISKERNEPPDIDVDFEHERREEVIQYIYRKYGRKRAALAATVITYRPRSAMRDVGKALGLADLQIDRLARSMQWWDGNHVDNDRVREAGLDPDSPVMRQLLSLVRDLLGFPRHLSQHVGGFVISEGPLAELVPVENAAMADRTVIQWEKNDLEDLGLLKVDVLGLGMLSAIRRSFDLIQDFSGRRWTLATVPAEDPAVYDMISAGDTLGVFQIESRAQMAMLPRLQPRNYYDLVIEVAIIRPGPIQGDMVHPYLRRRNGEEPVQYPSEAVRDVLKRTLGVPIFQEQVMQLAVVAAGFSPGEADQLRRAMAAWKRRGGLGPFEEKLKQGMRERGYEDSFAEQIFRQIKGFGDYGFPESHAASFALLVYVSAWLKCHQPAAFFCALLNSQPMGFYAPSQLVQAARRAGVTVRAVDVNDSSVDNTLEPDADGAPALRLGLREVKHLATESAAELVRRRPANGYATMADLSTRARVSRRDLRALADAGALSRVVGHRHRANWEAEGVDSVGDLLDQAVADEPQPLLRRPTEGEDLIADYRSTGLTLGRHPLALLRERLRAKGYCRADQLQPPLNGRSVYVAGLVITKQRPGSAAGVTFVTLEDESGTVNLVVWERTAEEQRRELLGARLLGALGEVQIESGVTHVIVKRLFDHTPLLGRLPTESRDFH